jgi:hypothetical protein
MPAVRPSQASGHADLRGASVIVWTVMANYSQLPMKDSISRVVYWQDEQS